MRLIYRGQATIDEKLSMRKADDVLFEFTGQKVVGTFGKFIDEEDFGSLQAAMEEIWEGKRERNIVAVRKQRDSEGEPLNYLVIEIKKNAFDFDDIKPLMLEIYSVEPDGLFAEEVNWKDKEVYDAFFAMLSGIMLLYDNESDGLIFQAGVSEQMLTLYKGTLSDWEQSFMPERLDKKSRAEFEALCNDMRSGQSSFRHKIRTDAFGQKGNMQVFEISCRKLQHDAFFRIVGVAAVDGELKMTPGLTDYVMDTGLPILSKQSITDYAKASLKTNPEVTYLVSMDLDDFKVVNDTYGHMFGDEVLLQMVEIIKNAIGKRGMLGRIGGDELMIVLTNVENDTELRNILRTVRTNIQWAFQEKKEGLHLTCSMGVAAYPTNAHSYDQMFQLADRMLYTAKKRGKNRYIIYTPEIHDAPKVVDNSEWNKQVEALREDKLGVMHRLVEEFLIRRVVTLENEFRELAACFELDMIKMVYDEGASTAILNQDGFSHEADEYTYFDYEPAFLEGFDQNNMFEVKGLYDIEITMPELKKFLEAQGVESALFYRIIKSSKMFGYIMFAKKSRRRLWAEYEKTMLGVVGKAIELTFTGK